MADDAKSVKEHGELATLLREHAEEISAVIEAAFVKEYPRSRSNIMDSTEVHSWSLGYIERLATFFETGDPALFSYRDSFGDVLDDPYSHELTYFASELSSEQFLARHIAPVVYRYSYTDGPHARKLLETLEGGIQALIRYNCDAYAARMGNPGMLMDQWNLLSGLRPDTQASTEDTPAKHFMPPERFKRLTRKGADSFARPEADELSPREKTVLDLIIDGKTNMQIAQLLGIKPNTVKNHVAHIFDKYNVNSRSELITKVLR